MDGSSSSSAEMQRTAKRSYTIRRGNVISEVKPQDPPPVKTRNNFASAIDMLGEDQVEKFHDKLAWVSGEWQAELDKLEKMLGTDEFKTLLQKLDKETAPELVDFRDRAYALKEMLASRPVQNVLHSKVKRMDQWDANSRAVLDVVRPQQQGTNLMSARKQAAIYYAWSIASAARAAAFVASMYSASKALTVLSVSCTAAVPLLAIFHTVTMIRDLYRTEESFYNERAKAYANMDKALMFMNNIGNPSLEDAGGVLRFLDACKKIPELSPTAKLEADKTYYAAMRERYFLPINLLASAIAQILNSLGASRVGGATLFGLSGLAYMGQAYCDWKQGDAEKHKAEDLRIYAQKWMENIDSELLKKWRAEDPENESACAVLLHHMERMSGQQGLEVAGGIVREVKAGANMLNAAGSLTVAATQLLNFVYKPSAANVVGTSISGVSTSYMAFTATKMYRRGDALVDSKRRREEAGLVEAVFDPKQVTGMMGARNQPVILQVPAGVYDEQTGFQTARREVSPSTNEHLAVGVLARRLALLTDPNQALPADHGQLLNVIQHAWKMPVIEMWAMLMVARGIQDGQRRLDFLGNRLAPLFKTDYPLMADTQRAAPLPAEVLVDQAIKHVSDLKSFRPDIYESGSKNTISDKHLLLGQRLHHELVNAGFFQKFNEDDFVAAINQVWAQRKQASGAHDAKARLYQARLVAVYIERRREQCGIDITKKMRQTDAAILHEHFSAQEVRDFREQLRLYLNAQVLNDPKARATAGLKLSSMPVVQRLIRESRLDSTRDSPLFSALECRHDIKPILGRLDIDPTIEHADDPDDIIITLSSSDSDSESSSDSESGDGEITDHVVNMEALVKARLASVGDDSDTDPIISSEDSTSDGSVAPPVLTPRKRGRLVERVFNKEALNRNKLMDQLENALNNRKKGDDDLPDIISELAESDADQSHMEDRY